MCSSSPSLAVLEKISDQELSDTAGADGIGFLLDDIQILGDPRTTLEIDTDSFYSDLYLDHIKLYNSNGDGTSISPSNGISWGTPSDPFKLNIITENLSRYNESTRQLDTNVPITYLQLAFPTQGSTSSNVVYQTNIGGDPTPGGGGETPNRTIEQTIPYDCTGAGSTNPDCATISFRSRWDLFKRTDDDSNPLSRTLALINRRIVWVEASDVNFHGSKINLWATPGKGISGAIKLVGHIGSLRASTNYNQGASQYTGPDRTVNRTEDPIKVLNTTTTDFDDVTFNYNYTETAANINKTFPFANDDTPNFSAGSQFVELSDVDVELYLGHLGFQPLFISTDVNARFPRSEPTGVNVSPDKSLLNLSLNIERIQNADQAELLYNSPKGNITIGNARIGADASGNCLISGGVICDFGQSSIKGIQIQYLNFRTQDLPKLTAAHCPTGWSCSFCLPGQAGCGSL